MNHCSLTQTNESLTLGNALTGLTIDRKRGVPAGWLHRGKNFDWNQQKGRTEIYDGLLDRHFRTDESPAECSVEVFDDITLAAVFRRRFTGAPWVMRETFRAEADAIHWEVELILDRGAPERSVEIRQLVPWPRQPWGWKLWSGNFNFPSQTHNWAGLHLEYGDVCYGTVIPAITVYNPVKDVGLAVAKPFGLPSPKLRFCFSDYWGEGIEVENSLLGLRQGKATQAAIMLRFQEGCFRPTLAWLLDKYPDYFLPGNPEVRRLEGGSTFGPPQVTEDDAARLAAAGINWYEIHHSMPYFGEYFPTFSEWGDGSRPGRPVGEIPTTHKLINDCGAILARHNIASLLYLQVCGDVLLSTIGKQFPESLARNAEGGIYPACAECAFVNSDPSLPFGQDMRRQIDGILKRYTDISGVFLDQACYNATDHAHDDGISMERNKPVYRLRFCYDKHLGDLCRRLHAQGKFIYANGSYDIELQRDFDGNMAESTSTVAKTMRYMHIAKPLLFFAYYQDETDVEEMLQQCLLAGASWSMWVPTTYSWFVRKGVTPGQQRLFDRYLPLCRRLLGRKILLEPNPLMFSKRLGAYAGEGDEVKANSDQNPAVDWEIFRGADGNIMISFVSRRKSCLDQQGNSRGLNFDLRLADAPKVTRAYALGAEYDGERPVEMIRHEDCLSMTLPVHGAASLIVLEIANGS